MHDPDARANVEVDEKVTVRELGRVGGEVDPEDHRFALRQALQDG